MKNFIIVLSCVLCKFSNLYGQNIDTAKYVRDTIYSNKNFYIGKPLSNIINAVPEKQVAFLSPDNQYSRIKGTAYYENITIIIMPKNGHAFRCLKVKLNERKYVDLKVKRQFEDNLWDEKMKIFLGNAVVVAIDKIQ